MVLLELPGSGGATPPLPGSGGATQPLPRDGAWRNSSDGGGATRPLPRVFAVMQYSLITATRNRKLS